MIQKQKILFFLHTMRGGGVENVLLNIFNNLNNENFEFTLLLIRKEGDFLEFIPKNVKIKYLALGNEFLSKNKILLIIQKIYRLIKLRILLKFPFLIRKLYIPDFYDVENAFLGDLVPIIDKIKRKKTLNIGWIHGDMYNDRHDNLLKNKILNASLNMDKVIYVSKKALDNGIVWNPSLKNNAEVIYNPIDKEKIIKKANESIDFKYDSFTFVCIGRLSGIKGYDNLLEVHKKLINDGIYHHIVIVGKGEDEDLLNDKIIKYDISNTFHLLGHKQNPYPYLKKADAYLLNSKSEGYPLAVKEALLLGKPMIVTKVGGVTEIVNDKNAIIIDFDKQQLYNSIKKMIIDSDFRESLERVNKKHFEEYNQNDIYVRYKELFNIKK